MAFSNSNNNSSKVMTDITIEEGTTLEKLEEAYPLGTKFKVIEPDPEMSEFQKDDIIYVIGYDTSDGLVYDEHPVQFACKSDKQEDFINLKYIKRI